MTKRYVRPSAFQLPIEKMLIWLIRVWLCLMGAVVMIFLSMVEICLIVAVGFTFLWMVPV